MTSSRYAQQSCDWSGPGGLIDCIDRQMMDSYRDAIDQILLCRFYGTTCVELLAVGQASVSGILTVLVVLISVQIYVIMVVFKTSRFCKC